MGRLDKTRSNAAFLMRVSSLLLADGKCQNSQSKHWDIWKIRLHYIIADNTDVRSNRLWIVVSENFLFMSLSCTVQAALSWSLRVDLIVCQYNSSTKEKHLWYVPSLSFKMLRSFSRTKISRIDFDKTMFFALNSQIKTVI